MVRISINCFAHYKIVTESDCISSYILILIILFLGKVCNILDTVIVIKGFKVINSTK